MNRPFNSAPVGTNVASNRLPRAWALVATLLILPCSGYGQAEPLVGNAKRRALQWTRGAALTETLADVGDLFGQDIVAAVGKDPRLPTSIHARLTVGQCLERLASLTRSDWFFQGATVYFLPVRDSDEAVLRLLLFREWWNNLPVDVRAGLLNRQVVRVPLDGEAATPLRRLAARESIDFEGCTGKEVRASLDYDVDVLLFNTAVGPNGRRVYRLVERVINSACSPSTHAGTPVSPTVATKALATQTRDATSATVDGGLATTVKPFVAPSTAEQCVNFRRNGTHTISELATLFSAALGTEVIPDRECSDEVLYLTSGRRRLGQLLLCLRDFLGLELRPVGPVYYFQRLPRRDVRRNGFSTSDAAKLIALRLGKLVTADDLRKWRIPFGVSAVRTTQFLCATQLSSLQRHWLERALSGGTFDPASSRAFSRALQDSDPRLYVRVVPRFCVRVGTSERTEEDRFVLKPFADIALDNLTRIPLDLPSNSGLAVRRLWVRQTTVRRLLPDWERNMTGFLDNAALWDTFASSLQYLARRKYAPLAGYLLRKGDAKIQALAARALRRLAEPAQGSAGDIAAHIESLLPALSAHEPEVRARTARLIGETCASLTRNNPIGSLGPLAAPYGRVMAALRRLAHGDPDLRVRWAANIALCAARRVPPTATQVELLGRALRGNDELLARWAVDALKARFDNQPSTYSPEEVEVLLEAAKLPSCRVRPAAISTLGRTGDLSLLPVLKTFAREPRLRIAATCSIVDLLNQSLERTAMGDGWTFEGFLVHQRAVNEAMNLHTGVIVPAVYFLGIAATPQSQAGRVLRKLGVSLDSAAARARKAIRDPAFQVQFEAIRTQHETEDGPEWWKRKPILWASREWEAFAGVLQAKAETHPSMRNDSLDILEALVTQETPPLETVRRAYHLSIARIQSTARMLGFRP